MTSVKRLLVLFSSCLAIAAAQTPVPVSDATKPVTVTIGGRDIVVPLPGEGFVRCDGLSEVFDKSVSGFLPPTNRLLAYFSTAADAEVLRKNGGADLSESFNLQTLNKLETEEVGTKTFASVRGSMRKEVEAMKADLSEKLKAVVEKGSTRMSEEMKVDAALSLSDAAVLGFFDEANPNAFGFTMAMNVVEKVGASEGQKLHSVTSAYMVPANGRLLLLYATRPFNNEGDRQEAERSVKAWGDAIVASNAKVEGKPAKGTAGALFQNVGKAAIIGAVVGGLAALVGILVVKNRRGAA